MHPLELRRRSRRASCSSLADPILDRFDVMVGARLDGLDGGDIGGTAGSLGMRSSQRARRGRQRGQCAAPPARRPAPANHAHSTRTRSRIKPGFAEYAADFGEFGGISAIEGRECIGQRDGHRSAGSLSGRMKRFYRKQP